MTSISEAIRDISERAPEPAPDSVPTEPRPELGRRIGRRERVNSLRARMESFSSIYNAAWFVRNAYFGPEERRKRYAQALLLKVYEELCRSDDCEAILFAVADALYSSPAGVPWEG